PAVAFRPDAAGRPRVAPARGLGSLTLEQTSFVGRGREIAEIAQALGRTRLLTLTGPGGAGKTRLACEVAAGLGGRYPDGVHVAELASLSRPELVPHTVAAVLDVPIPGPEAAEAALARQLADRRLLLVLDNCEHLLDACARLTAEVLRGCPGVIVLATSREPLRVGGEVTWRTPSLALRICAPCHHLIGWRSWSRYGCSSSERTTPPRASRSTRRPRRQWPRSASAWTGCRWLSNSRRPGPRPSRPARSRRGWAMRYGCWTAAADPRSPASRRCTPRWRGATICSTGTSVSCSGAWPSSPAAWRWRLSSRCAAMRAWMSSICSAGWSTSPWCRSSTSVGRRATVCWRQ